jgi:hypothetical protein
MNINGREGVYGIDSSHARRIITMQTRDRMHASAVVITMPRSRPQSKVVTLPVGTEHLSAESMVRPETHLRVRSGFGALSAGVRITLVALFALLGWPHPTRDNDPGPSAARPCHWERTSLISRLWLPFGKRRVAASEVRKFPEKRNPSSVLVRAA